MQFKVRRILTSNIKEEIKQTGFSASWLDFGVAKHQFLNIKIYDLKPETATIIKQAALSVGADAAVHSGVLDHSAKKSNLILSGTVSQICNIAEKLRGQQFSSPKIADEILKQINIFNTGNTLIKPQIMGILNITEDSFSDGGIFIDPKNAINHAYKMIEEGADIIDIGAESTRPGAKAISPDTEIKRITPVLKELKGNCKVKISIDTRNAQTAHTLADLGADIINDISGLNWDKDMAKTVASTKLQVVITHSRGTPETMDTLCDYNNTIDEVYFELLQMTENALAAGVKPEKIIIDPGFGFAKNNEQNFEILSRIEEFKSMGYPVLCGLSRKRFIKSLIPPDVQNQDTAEILDNITTQASLYLGIKNINIIRVHNVAKTKQALDLAGKLV